MQEIDLSIVFQGPFNKNTSISIDRIKNIFPNCEIIVSSWKEDSNKFVLDKDIITTFSYDPGPDFIDSVTNVADNFSRQWLSTINGLELASKKYSLKVRTDILIEEEFKKINTLVNIFQNSSKKYAVCTAGSVDPMKFPILCHFSDLIQFAETKELIKLWGNSLRSIVSEDFIDITKRKLLFGISGGRFARLACEQRLWLNNSNYELSVDSYGKDLFLLHNKHIEEILLFKTEDFGIRLPSRIYEDSESFKYFFDNNFNKITYKKWLLFRFNIKHYKRFIKSFISIIFLLFLPFSKFIKN